MIVFVLQVADIISSVVLSKDGYYDAAMACAIGSQVETAHDDIIINVVHNFTILLLLGHKYYTWNWIAGTHDVFIW